MANFLNHLAVFFLLSILFLQTTSARESKFFSKITRESTYNNHESKINSNVQEAPAPANEESPTTKPQTSKNGYGLYGYQSGRFSPYISSFNFPFRSHYQEPLNNYNANGDNKDFFHVNTDNTKQDEGTIKGEARDDHYFYSNAVYYNPEYGRKEFIDNYNLQQQKNAESDVVDRENYNFDSYSDSTGPRFKRSSYSNSEEDMNQEKNKNGFAHEDENANAYQHDNGMKGYELIQEEQGFSISP